MSITGVIGGSGFYSLPGFSITEEREIPTPYGPPSAPFAIGQMDGKTVAFLARHGIKHNRQPHMVNYRANIWAMRELGAKRIFSISASGGIAPALRPGDIVLLDQVLDFTQGARPGTFYESGESVVHVDFSEPFCPDMRRAVLEASSSTGHEVVDGGTYVCVNGPRLESRAEIKMFAAMGAHVVGMTAMPEAALAREMELCYCGLSTVTNYAAGISETKLTVDEVVREMAAATERIYSLLRASLNAVDAPRTCQCGSALGGAVMDKKD